jgi:hypothetical protein
MGTDLMYRREEITEGVESNHLASYVLFRNHLTTLQQVQALIRIGQDQVYGF